MAIAVSGKFFDRGVQIQSMAFTWCLPAPPQSLMSRHCAGARLWLAAGVAALAREESPLPALTRFGELSLPIGKSSLQSVIEHTSLLALPVGRDKLRAGLERFGLLYRSSGDGKVISLDGGYGSAFTGATAAALLAELQYYQATADGRVGQLRAAWLTPLQDDVESEVPDFHSHAGAGISRSASAGPMARGRRELTAWAPAAAAPAGTILRAPG